MPPRLRRFMLTAHVVSSVGWLGAVAASLVLGLAGLTSRDAETLRAAYLSMELIGWFVLVPLSLASLLTGLVQALGTRWGLFRHYWVVFKLVINVFAAAVLLLYMQTLGYLAGVAASAGSDLSELESPSAALHAGGALLLLLLAAMLSVYKPRGLTRYGQRRQHEQDAVSRS